MIKRIYVNGIGWVDSFEVKSNSLRTAKAARREDIIELTNDLQLGPVYQQGQTMYPIANVVAVEYGVVDLGGMGEERQIG